MKCHGCRMHESEIGDKNRDLQNGSNLIVTLQTNILSGITRRALVKWILLH